MANLTLPAGITILSYVGTAALPLTGASKPTWFTTANFTGIYKQSANRSSFIGCLPQSSFPPFTTLDAPTSGALPSGYVFLLKQSITVDGTLFVPTAAPSLTQLAAPANGQASPLTSSPASALSVSADSVANNGGYQLYTSATQTGTYAALGGVLATPSYNHTGLSAAQTAWYKWMALGNGTSTADSPLGMAFSGTTQAASTTPVISSLTPNTAAVGDTVTINGTNLASATSVQFGSLAASITSNSSTQVKVVVPSGATTSLITVATANGSSTIQFNLTPPANAPVPNVLWTGNSLIANPSGPVATAINLMPPTWTHANEAIGGQGITSMINNIASQVDPHYKSGASKNIIIFQEGTNEIADYDTKVRQYYALLKQRGWTVILDTTPPRTSADDGSLVNINNFNTVFRNVQNEYYDVLVDLSRNVKVGRFGDVNNWLDSAHASNNTTYYNQDHVHWLDEVNRIVGYMHWDALNYVVNGIPMPDPLYYPPNQTLPGQQVTFTQKNAVIEVNGGIRPIDDQQGGFVAHAVSGERIAAGSGFCGAFQWEVEVDGGFCGVGVAGQAASQQSNDNGFYNGVVVVNKSGENALGATRYDVMRVEMYEDRTILFKNNQPQRTIAQTPPFPAQLYMNLSGGSYQGIRNVRVEGNII